MSQSHQIDIIMISLGKQVKELAQRQHLCVVLVTLC